MTSYVTRENGIRGSTGWQSPTTAKVKLDAEGSSISTALVSDRSGRAVIPIPHKARACKGWMVR
jgi:hypothetical protein